MVIGIIAEGKGDCAVLENILWSILDADNDEIRFLRPDFNNDESDLQSGVYKDMTADKFSSWTLVKKDCEEQTKFKNHLVNNPTTEEHRIVVHLDTAECEDYGVIRPAKDDDYCTNLRQVVMTAINTWLGNQFQESLHYAICIEETEAWLLPIYEKKDSSVYPNAKERFLKILNEKGNKDSNFQKQLKKAFQQNEFDKMGFFSKELRKSKTLSNTANYNQSLNDFTTSF